MSALVLFHPYQNSFPLHSLVLFICVCLKYQWIFITMTTALQHLCPYLIDSLDSNIVQFLYSADACTQMGIDTAFMWSLLQQWRVCCRFCCLFSVSYLHYWDFCCSVSALFTLFDVAALLLAFFSVTTTLLQLSFCVDIFFSFVFFYSDYSQCK